MNKKQYIDYLKSVEFNYGNRVKQRLGLTEVEYRALCRRRSKEIDKSSFNIVKGETLEEFLKIYQDYLGKGGVYTYQEDELWLMNKKRTYWQIDEVDGAYYYEVPKIKFAFLKRAFFNVAAWFSIRNALIIGLAVWGIVFTSLFIWKAATTIPGPTHNLNINCENCNYTVLGNKTSFQPHEVAYITFNETDPDMYKLADAFSSQCFKVEGDVEDSRRYYGDTHTLAVEFGETDVTIDASAFDAFTTLTLKEKSSYDPVKFKVVADTEDNIYVDWGDGVKSQATPENHIITGNPLGDVIHVYSNDVYGLAFNVNAPDSQIVDISLGYYITTIPDHSSFSGGNLTAAKNIVFGPNIESIGSFSFDSFKAEGDLYINSQKLINLGEGAFRDSEFSSIHIECPNAVVGNSPFGSMDNVKTLDLKVKTIMGSNMASNCSNITRAYVETESVGDNSYNIFGGCSKLKELVFVGSNEMKPIETKYSSSYFGLSGNTAIKSIKFVNFKEFTYRAEFQNCSNLSQVDLGEKIGKITDAFFENCISLTSMVIPSRVHVIEQEIFNGCSQLESIISKGNISYLKQGVFNRCASLKIIDFSNNISYCPDTTNGDPFGATPPSSIEEIRVFDTNTANLFKQNSYFSAYADKIVAVH